jgi:hypothetical protein
MAVGNPSTAGILKASPSIPSTDPRVIQPHDGTSEESVGITSPPTATVRVSVDWHDCRPYHAVVGLNSLS